MDIRFKCQGCGCRLTFESFEESIRTGCPECGGEVFEMDMLQVVNRNRGPGNAGIGGAGGGAGLVGDLVIAAINHESTSHQASRDAHAMNAVEPNVPFSAIRRMMHGGLSPQNFIARRRRERKESVDALLPTDGVHCLECGDIFLPATKQVDMVRELMPYLSHSDRYCSAQCERSAKSLECRACRKRFVEPKSETSAQAGGSDEKSAWLNDGFCSLNCQQRTSLLSFCRYCGKSFVMPRHADKRPGGVLEWLAARMCSDKCHSLFQEGSPPFAPQVSRAPVKCPGGHDFTVPGTLVGKAVLCPQHQIRLVAKPSALPVQQTALRSGDVHLQNGDETLAISDFSHAIGAEPSELTGWLKRGKARTQVGDVGGAIADLTWCLKLDSACKEAMTLRDELEARVAQEMATENEAVGRRGSARRIAKRSAKPSIPISGPAALVDLAKSHPIPVGMFLLLVIGMFVAIDCLA